MSGVSRAAATADSSTAFTGARLSPPPPPGLDAFPVMGKPADNDGDSLLDDLLGLDDAAPFKCETAKTKSETVENSPTSHNRGALHHAGRGGGGVVVGSRRGGTAAAATAWSGFGGSGGGGANMEGDSVIDALLGLELDDDDPNVAGEGNTGDVMITGGDRGDGEFFGVEDDVRGSSSSSSVDKAVEFVTASTAEGVGRRRIEEGDDGDVALLPPPFDGTELGRLCRHLNDRNRRAKRLAQRCQEMFLRLFFKVRFFQGGVGGGWVNVRTVV